MENIPIYFDLLFIAVVATTLFLFYKAASSSKIVLITLLCLLIVQGIVGATGFYTHTSTLPPRLALALMPPLLGIVILFSKRRGRNFIDSIDLKKLTLIHVIRIPVEFILYGLFVYRYIPEAMTFVGRNFDIISGISAPLVFYFVFVRMNMNRIVFLTWNVICLLLLINVVVIAVLSIPYPFQQLNFNQPNIGVLIMPYVWLPAIVVPIVLFSHLIAIRQLLISSKKNIIVTEQPLPNIVSIESFL